MKDVISNLSNERLEQEIAAIYLTVHQDGKVVEETEGSFLNLYWNEFEERLAAGAINPDTDWEPKGWKEGFYE